MSGKRRAKRAIAADGTITVHGKNANGGGSVYQTKDGRWVATWNEPGRRYPRQATGKSRDEAIRKRAERRSQAQPEERQTLGDVADWWLHKVFKPKVSIDTWHKAEERLPRIKQELGDLAPHEVGYAAVVELLSELSKELKAGKTNARWRTGPLPGVADEQPTCAEQVSVNTRSPTSPSRSAIRADLRARVRPARQSSKRTTCVPSNGA